MIDKPSKFILYTWEMSQLSSVINLTYLKKANLNWVIIPNRLAYGHVCGVIFWLVIDAGVLIPLEVGAIGSQIVI